MKVNQHKLCGINDFPYKSFLQSNFWKILVNVNLKHLKNTKYYIKHLTYSNSNIQKKVKKN